jgi:hypothetical protein
LAGVSRASLHRAFGEGKCSRNKLYHRRKPNWATLEATVEVLGFRLELVRVEGDDGVRQEG